MPHVSDAWRPLFIFGPLGLLLLVYLGSLVLAPSFHYSIVLNGWLPDVFEIVVAGLCLVRAAVSSRYRAVALFLGLGLLSWALGDLIWTIQVVAGANSVTNLLGAICWLGFYPLAYVAMVLCMRRELRALTTPSWLDGAVAALGTAAVCSAFAFHGLVQLSGASALSDATNVAYPLGDLLLLGLAAGSMALLSGRRLGTWSMLAAACVLNCVGDTFNLFQSTEDSYRLDAILHAIAWPTAGLVMTVALWLPERPVDVTARQRPTGLLLPGLAAASALALLVTATLRPVARISLVLAAVTLVTAGVRLLRSAQRLRALTEQRHRLSMTDELTGLDNRRFLYEVLGSFFDEQAEHTARPRTLAFLFVDLNNFKEVNDHFGHLAGDELLKQLGPRLSGCLRACDVLVRVGGDEFAVVLMDADVEHATNVARRLSAALEEPFVLKGVNATISASIGVAMVPTDATTIEGLLQCADVAMYRSKLERGSFAFFDPGVDVGNQWRLGDELRGAIERRQFALLYQPQVDLDRDEIAGVEALVRWRHPRLGLLSPAKFLPLAEHAGLMPALTALLLETAVEQAAEWQRAACPVSVSVNISATNLLDEGLVELVRRLLGQYALPAELLVLEITETSVIANFEESSRVIEALRELGLVVSVDDFGAGFTSLSYLSSLAVGELKLDGKLITGIAAPERERDRDLVRSTIELGHALGLRVVAEGVEDAETLALVRGLGADYAQGYFVGRPVPPEDLALRPAVALDSGALLAS